MHPFISVSSPSPTSQVSPFTAEEDQSSATAAAAASSQPEGAQDPAEGGGGSDGGFFVLEESSGYMKPSLRLLAVTHTLFSFCCIIGYYCLKVTAASRKVPPLGVRRQIAVERWQRYAAATAKIVNKCSACN